MGHLEAPPPILHLQIEDLRIMKNNVRQASLTQQKFNLSSESGLLTKQYTDTLQAGCLKRLYTWVETSQMMWLRPVVMNALSDGDTNWRNLDENQNQNGEVFKMVNTMLFFLAWTGCVVSFLLFLNCQNTGHTAKRGYCKKWWIRNKLIKLYNYKIKKYYLFKKIILKKLVNFLNSFIFICLIFNDFLTLSLWASNIS